MRNVIEVTNISKKYKYGETKPYYTLRESILEFVSNPIKRIRGNSVLRKDEFWALKDVSFKVEEGQVLGVIGANGSGKSTLLKILSRITPPTKGEAKLLGRVASLLEVGTGFNQELTGRENIFLNGAILGMTQKEIKAKFDEIVDFSGVEKFLDTPVKRYSSGMYVRLAFAVAAHLNPEILLVDEVLAVGDNEFQKRSLNRMRQMVGEGRTVVFVSHNLNMVKAICNTGLFLLDGKNAMCGPVDKAISEYSKSNGVLPNFSNLTRVVSNASIDDNFKLINIRVYQGEKTLGPFYSDKSTYISIEFEVRKPIENLRLYIDVLDTAENLIFRSFNDMQSKSPSRYKPGRYLSTVEIFKDTFSPKDYIISVGVGIYNVRSFLRQNVRIPISVLWGGSLNIAYPNDTIRGLLSPNFTWITKDV